MRRLVKGGSKNILDQKQTKKQKKKKKEKCRKRPQVKEKWTFLTILSTYRVSNYLSSQQQLSS